MEAMSGMHAVDKLLNQLIVQRQSTAADRALQVVVVRLANPFENCVAGAEPGFGNKSNSTQVAEHPVYRRLIEFRANYPQRLDYLRNSHVALGRPQHVNDRLTSRCGSKS